MRRTPGSLAGLNLSTPNYWPGGGRGRGCCPGMLRALPGCHRAPPAPLRPAREMKAPPGHGPGCAPFPNPSLPKTQRFLPSSSSGEVPALGGMPSQLSGSCDLPSIKLPPGMGARRGLAAVAPEAREVAGSCCSIPVGQFVSPGPVLCSAPRRG